MYQCMSSVIFMKGANNSVVKSTHNYSILEHQKTLQDELRDIEKCLVLLKAAKAQVNQNPKINQALNLIYALVRFY